MNTPQLRGSSFERKIRLKRKEEIEKENEEDKSSAEEEDEKEEETLTVPKPSKGRRLSKFAPASSKSFAEERMVYCICGRALVKEGRDSCDLCLENE